MKTNNPKIQPTEFQQKIRERFTVERILGLLDEGAKAETSKYFGGACVGSEPAFMVRLAYLKAAVELAGLAALAPSTPETPETPEEDDRLTKALGNLTPNKVV
jgi:hypothetical protein